MAQAVETGKLKELADFAASLTGISRPIIHQWFRHAPSIDVKDDATPVTIADKSVEAALREAITGQFPDHGLIGEEHGSINPGADFTWVVDPIDGTRAFSCGNPLFGTLIALLYQGAPVIGVIDIPALDQQWLGVEGLPSQFNGSVITTHEISHLAEARLTTTSTDALGDDLPRFKRLSAAARVTGFGGDCAGYGHLACGWSDCIAESGLMVYDIMATIPVIKGAGGVVTQWDGKPIILDTFDGTALASASAALHDEAIAQLA